MQHSRYQWQGWTDAETAHRRAGGRRRHNPMRRRLADARRAAMFRALMNMGPAAIVFPRGLALAFAQVFGVHRSTAWRDLQRILNKGPVINFTREGEVLYTVDRACQGGPVIGVQDADGNEIRGPERRRIVKSLPRYRRRR